MARTDGEEASDELVGRARDELDEVGLQRVLVLLREALDVVLHVARVVPHLCDVRLDGHFGTCMLWQTC